MSILSNPFPEGGWYNDTCIFGPVYGFIKNNYILYENTWENRHNVYRTHTCQIYGKNNAII